MAKDLVIVESPAKARTIERFLGKDIVAKASMGHVRDIPRKEIGVNVSDRTFVPKYTILPDKRKVVSELTKASREAETVYLATDPDREGEAISWHLIKAAKIEESKTKRIVFHEITERAVVEAFQNPRELDYHLIDAQQARRVLDRLVGYELSPVLWRKVRRGLSAGRVQSAALRLVVDRQRDIDAFVAREYWSVDAEFVKSGIEGDGIAFKSRLRSINGKKGKVDIPDKSSAQSIVEDLGNAEYRVNKVSNREKRSKPSPPFITSTLQQEASRKLRFTASRTMVVAQQLYEGINLGDKGPTGLITYMRTDSTNVSELAINETRDFVKEKFGLDYLPPSVRRYKKKTRGAQEAHEAIRPTSIYIEPSNVKQYLSNEQARLYELVWKRMVASQMADAVFDATNIDIETRGTTSSSMYMFRSEGSILKFPGFRRLYMEDKDDVEPKDQEDSQALPQLGENELLNQTGLIPEQHFTQPPPRFTDATLVKMLEEQGIGRPSTYAPTLTTVMDRDYVRKEKGRFFPTKLGVAVNELLTAHFPDVMDIGFTARIEEELDGVAAGEREWVPLLREFYDPFNEAVSRALDVAEKVPSSAIDEETDIACEKCERMMVIKTGRFGAFLACSGFPDCRNSKPLNIGVQCPDCGDDIVERKQKGKRGRTFYGCSGYPNCKFTIGSKPLSQPCPECGKLLIGSGRASARCTSCNYRGQIPEDNSTDQPGDGNE